MSTVAAMETDTESQSPASTMKEIRSEIAQLKEMEAELSESAWLVGNTDQSADGQSSSPRGVADDDAESSKNSALLIQRYEQARDLYLQRRMENLLVEHIQTFNEEAANDTDIFEFPESPNDSEKELQERHAQALASLTTALEQVQSQQTQLCTTYDVIVSRRQELEQMLEDVEEDVDTNTDDGDDDDNNNDDLMGIDQDVDDQALKLEQERIEELQQAKRQLQEKLAQIQKETKETVERTREHQSHLEKLRNENSSLNIDQEDAADLKKKIEELREMKLFYDNLREVMEELGGVKILNVEENAKDRNLQVSLLMYDQFRVQVELQVYRKHFLKLVHAKWYTEEPRVKPSTNKDNDDKESDDFSLPLAPLDDLVQVAKSTMHPPHDMRFLVRESLARIRFTQLRVNDIAHVRTHVLTKVHNRKEVVCSLNDGIVIVMHLFERYVWVEKIVGIGGWDEESTEKIRKALPKANDFEHPLSVTEIVRLVQEEVQKLKMGGLNPSTPRLPLRGTQNPFQSKDISTQQS